MNPRQMKQAMKKMGIAEEEIDDAIAVIIRTKKEDIIIRNPSVSKVNMMGTWTYQIIGEEEHRQLEEEKIVITEEDIKTVAQQSGCSEDKAKAALEESNGDLAAAIISLTES